MEHFLTEAAEQDTNDEVTIDIPSNYESEHFMHSSKHNKNNNLSFFDSIDLESMGLSQDGNMSMSKEKMRASLEEVA